MRIAILGATSQIAVDLIRSMIDAGNYELYLYSRRPTALKILLSTKANAVVRHNGDFASFGSGIEFNALLNFVGLSNPAAVAQVGAEIFDITYRFDELALSYIRKHIQCRYIFLSSGAVYGSNFLKPADRYTPANFPINNLTPQDWYGAAKLYAECRHRSFADLQIIDVRVFNYFSASQDLTTKFLICDIIRAVRGRATLRTSAENIIRDYLHPSDFYRLIEAALKSPSINVAVDGYSRSTISKFTLLKIMKDQFGLNFELVDVLAGVNSTGNKPNYYSLNTRASELGYKPALTSIDGILREAALVLK